MRKIKWVEHVARMEEIKNAYSLLVGKPEGRKPLGRTRRMLVDNIKMDVIDTGLDGVDCTGLAQYRC
jgi:hypothetical protein